MAQKPQRSIEEIARQDGRYPAAAVHFVREGLGVAVRQVFGGGQSDEPRHVSGEQLCLGLRELALKRWGYLARPVLRHWNIHTTRDFGEIVFLLVDSGWMHRQDEDILEDFDDVFDFADAFEQQIDFESEDDD